LSVASQAPSGAFLFPHQEDQVARYSLFGTLQDGNGAAVSGATVTIYLADTTTVPTMYSLKSGGTTVTSATTDAKGYWIVYVDDGDYPLVTLFDISISKTGFVSTEYADVW
jgi:hypothetical protein